MARTGYLSEGTADFTSNTSFWGNANLVGNMTINSALTASRITATDVWAASGITGANVNATSRFSGFHHAPAGSAVTPSYAFTSALSLGMYAVSSITLGFVGGIDFRTNANILSFATGTTGSGLTIGQVQLLFQASGMSFVYSSGKTLYTIGASAASATQP